MVILKGRRGGMIDGIKALSIIANLKGTFKLRIEFSQAGASHAQQRNQTSRLSERDLDFLVEAYPDMVDKVRLKRSSGRIEFRNSFITDEKIFRTDG
jgi:hypothetical protein